MKPEKPKLTQNEFSAEAGFRISQLEYKVKNQAISLKNLSERFIVLSGLVEHHCHCVHSSVT